jgi:hypothetical protein
MVGPWNGIRPQQTQVPLSDVELGLSSTSIPRRVIVSHFISAADTLILLSFV